MKVDESQNEKSDDSKEVSEYKRNDEFDDESNSDSNDDSRSSNFDEESFVRYHDSDQSEDKRKDDDDGEVGGGDDDDFDPNDKYGAITNASGTTLSQHEIEEAPEDDVLVETVDGIDEEDYVERNDDDNRIDSPEDFRLEDLHEDLLHETCQKKYESDRQKLIGKMITQEVVIDGNKHKLEWKIVKDSDPELPLREYENVGIRGIDFTNPSETIASDTFFKLWPGDCKKQHHNLNHWINVFNNNHDGSRKMKLVTEREWYNFLAGVLAATGYDETNEELWKGSFRFRVCLPRHEKADWTLLFSFQGDQEVSSKQTCECCCFIHQACG